MIYKFWNICNFYKTDPTQASRQFLSVECKKQCDLIFHNDFIFSFIRCRRCSDQFMRFLAKEQLSGVYCSTEIVDLGALKCFMITWLNDLP